MKKLCTIIIVLGSFCLIGAEEIFNESFDSDDAWVLAHGDVEKSISGGQLVVENTGSSWAFFKHDADISTFTYTVKINALTDHAALGITFCWQSSTFEGYVLALWNTDSVSQYYSLLKMTRQGQSSVTQPLLTGWNSFITKRSNELKVSKSGSRLDLFCNGVWIDSTSDTTFERGSIGLVMGEGEKAGFDYAIVDNEYETGSPPRRFEDDFEQPGLGGWRVYFDNVRSVEASDGVMKVATGGDDHETKIITNGEYQNVPVQAVVTRTGGAEDGFYGLILMETVFEKDSVPPLSYYDSFVFKVNGDRNYAAYYLSTRDSIKYSVFPPHSSVHGTTDTLLVTEDYEFVVNGDTLPDIDFSPLNFEFNAVGFVVDSGVSVEFDNFAAGDTTEDPTPPIAVLPKSWRPPAGNPAFELGGPGLIYDTRGRVVGRYNGSLKDSLRHLGAGRFFIVPKDRNGLGVQRAIINVR
ncbi:MAG: hypothetical protein GF418_02835 [Chitinivibrionales bacterium]|nr:hypothetical protein [Chitinivibrionales bacterium]MBD3394538.1 hypothetical protein [Chitinivibrionales bacterium]